MNKSESIKNLSKALLTAQKAMGGATKGSANPFFKSRYADYGAVLEAVKDPLNDAGIAVLQPHTSDASGDFVVTMLLHGDTGEFISSSTKVVCAKQNDPQALGSAITYARRFGLESMLSLPREDDDGNAASGKGYTPPAKPAATPAKASEAPKAPAAKAPEAPKVAPKKEEPKPAVAAKVEKDW